MKKDHSHTINFNKTYFSIFYVPVGPTIRKPVFDGYPPMLVGYMRVSSDSDRQSTDLQRDALLAAGVDERHLFEDHASGAKNNRPGLDTALAWENIILYGDYILNKNKVVL